MALTSLTINGTEYKSKLVDLYWTKMFNRIKTAEILIGDVTESDSNLDEENEIIIEEDSTEIWRGVVRNASFPTNKIGRIQGAGYGIRLRDRIFKDSSGNYYKKWSNETSKTIIEDLVFDEIGTPVSGISNGNIEAYGTSYDFKVENDSLLSAIKKNCNITGYEWSVTRSGGSNNLNFEEHQGSDSSTYTFTTGTHVYITRREKDTKKIANAIQVIGQGSGKNKIVSDVKEDPTSQSDYGLREFIKVDRSIKSKATADLMADNYLTSYKEKINRITLEVYKIDFSVLPVIGDLVTINDTAAGLSSDDYRVKGITRQIGSSGNLLKYEVGSKLDRWVETAETMNRKADDEQLYSKRNTIRQGEDNFFQATYFEGF